MLQWYCAQSQKFSLALSKEVVEMMYQTRHEANAVAGEVTDKLLVNPEEDLVVLATSDSDGEEWELVTWPPLTRKADAEPRVIVLEVGSRENGMDVLKMGAFLILEIL